MLLEVFVAIVVGLFTLWLYCYLKAYVPMKNIPSPTVWPIIGNALEFKNPEESFYTYTKLMKQLNSKTIRVHIGFDCRVVTADYALIERILSSSTMINKNYFTFIPWLGHGVFTSNGDQWRKSRKIINPTFHIKVLEQFLNAFNSNSAILTNKLEKHLGDSSVDIYPYVKNCVLDILCETAMGVSVNAQGDAAIEYGQWISNITNIIHTRSLRPFYHIDFIYKRTKMHRDEQALIDTINEHTNSIIKTRRQRLQEEAEDQAVLKTTENDDQFRGKKKKPFLDLLLQSTIDGRPLSDRELRDEVSTFMLGGQDSSAVATSYTLFLLANHPLVQERAFAEMVEIFGNDRERMCTMADINEMKYLEMVIKESMRLYPPATQISRTVTEDLEYNGTTIPLGTRLMIILYSIHHDSEYYPDPEKFDPERFSPENYDKSKPFSFIPFSAGPRNCMGHKYAMIEMKCLLSILLRHFELTPATPEHMLRVRMSVALKPENGVKIAITKRRF